MDRFCLIVLGFVFGSCVVYGLMKLEQANAKRKADFDRRLKELEDQIKGKQLPFHVRDGLEDIKALENEDLFDLVRLGLHLQEMVETVDRAISRQKRMGEVYEALRNPKNKKKGDL